MPRTADADTGAAPGAAAFAVGLQAEHDALGAFVSLLQLEQEILIQGDAERLASLAPDKAAKINLLAILGEQRNRHLASQSLSANTEGMRAWLKRNPGFAAGVSKTWKELLARAETARQINQNNGILIESRMHQNRQKLAVLQLTTASDGVYRPDGRLRPLQRARSISQV